MRKPEEYKYIRAWGNYLGSREYYIKQEQENAAHDNAPIDALYVRVCNSESRHVGEWATFSELRPALQAEIQWLVDRNDRILGGRK